MEEREGNWKIVEVAKSLDWLLKYEEDFVKAIMANQT